MDRNQKPIYCFIYDENKEFYRATQSANGVWAITHNAQMYPLRNNPKNLLDSPVEFATNKRYLSMNRTINYPLEFVFDGAAILNYKYTIGKGVNEILFYAMFEFNPENGEYKLSYNGRIDFKQKDRDEKLGTFKVPVVDDSAWGILSQNDDVEYSIDCSESNPKAIRVLIDNFTLKNRFTFQTVGVVFTINQELSHGNGTCAIGFVLINQDGDSAGLIVKSQTLDYTSDYNTYISTSLNNHFYSAYPINGVNMKGTINFSATLDFGFARQPLKIFFGTSTGQERVIANFPDSTIILGNVYNIDYDFNINLAAGEKMFIFFQVIQFDDPLQNHHYIINMAVRNSVITTLTKAEPTIVYGLRPLDLVQEIVRRGTFERYSINSNFFVVNNKTVLVPAESARGVRDSRIYTSFRDFFETFSALFFMANKVVNGSLFMELADEVYKQDTNIIDLGELIECRTTPALEYFVNEIEVGSPNQDYRHPSGRLEFNSISTFSLPFSNVKEKLSLITKYRTDGLGLIFLILDYKENSTQDNSGDKAVFVVDITDEQGSAVENVETFENINVNNAPLAPIIKYPLDGDVINFDKPFLKGVGIPGSNVNVYVNTALDGGTVVAGDGTWSYQIVTSLPSYNPGVFDGVNVIDATNTDLVAPHDTIQLIIDTTVSASTGITYPRFSDVLYNNLPLIRGVAPAGTNININLDGVLLAAVVADNSCKFEFKCVVPITNAVHTLNIGAGSISFTVNSFVDSPLITYIGSELDGFVLVNNLPLIKGVAKPGTIVTLWLNYITYSSLGSAIADLSGNWSFQVIPTTYTDPISGLPVVIAPIKNGLNVVSTDLVNHVVQISVSGFKLNRPAYDSITGVTDNTVFNTRLSDKRMLLNHKSLLASIMNKHKNELIEFQTHNKNPNLVTVLGTDVVSERADVPYSELGQPLMLLEKANIKCIARKNFTETLYDFNNGGYIKANFKGKDLFFLPIGSMKMKNIMDDVQDWELLFSPLTPYSTLLNLSRNGLTINLMENAIFHSDANSMHAVEYNYQQPNNFNFASMYSDWFDNRNSAWLFGKTDYIQKFQKDEIIRDQIITNGISAMTLKIYRCLDATLVDTIDYEPVAPSPIPIPEIVLEAEIDWNDYPEDQYFCVAYVGEVAVFIFERVEIRTKWYKTILTNSYHSVNQPGVFYSTGFRTIVRIEGLVRKLQPDVDSVTAKEESGNSKLLWSSLSKKRMIRYGNARGIPDYMAIKMATALLNDNCSIEGTLYTIQEGEKINPSEDIPGVPMYYYEVMVNPKENTRGKVFPGVGSSDRNGVIVVVDATAIGLSPNNIIMIEDN